MAQSCPLSAEIETVTRVLRLVEAFRAFDGDNDGHISVAELGGIMASLGYNASEQEVRAMMQQGDKNRDGLLSIDEFLELNTKDLQSGDLANFLRTAFQALDEDGNEVLMAEELHELMANLGPNLSLENCNSIVASLDVNGDGVVDMDDIRLIVNCLP
ncbi:hypothetical protein L6164_030523 [Bauhinia variegata]|uniref:Uncharacterized protein n=1 Tax=Bauhinia variegata TaxID=167791 RepID=A0ACB9LD01_BAUVA|nr:hypothetical protein L6164_030523 [Bauhinia variegata]